MKPAETVFRSSSHDQATRAVKRRGMQEICVVIPCFNEARRFRAADLIAFLRSHPHAGLCLVDDGSDDDTLAALQQVQSNEPDRILVRRLEHNSGKAAAVRAGVLHVAALRQYSFIGYWDADLSTPLDEVDHLLAALKSDSRYLLAMGSRVKRLGSRIERRAARHVLGRMFAACATAVLGLSTYDSQCGAKIFRSEVVDILFGQPFLTRWLFDLEMLVRLRNEAGAASLDMSIEVPLRRWQEVGGSKLRLREKVAVPLELLRIRMHYNHGRTDS
jgi:dolichyl-phosphate beta-glucosyltransferase